MIEVKDPLQAIQEALDVPIEVVEATQFDDAAIARFMAARYSKSTLKDEIFKDDSDDPIENE